MKLQFEKVFSRITQAFGKKNKKTKVAVITLIVAFFAVCVIAAVLMNSGEYVELYNGLSSSEAGEVAAQLSEMDTDFRVQSDGSILVPKEQESTLKMTLAEKGYPQSTLNYDIFTGNSSFMTTDYEKREYLLFQLQNRLQDAITTLDSIESAIVTISLPEEDSFVLQEDKTPATASVVLNLETGAELTSEQVKGIETLVSRSVPDLANENVVLVDGKGNILNDQVSDDADSSGYTRLDLESTINQTLESKITKILEPVFGLGSIRVAVNASVEINKSVSEETTYTPTVEDGGVISKQSKTKSSGSTQTAEGTPGTDTNSEVPTYPQADDASGSQSNSESTDTEYLVNQLREQVEHDGYEIKDISAAVLVNSKELSEEQTQILREMVASSSGISVEKITLTNAEFALGNSSASFGNEEEESDNRQILLYVGIGVGALLILIAGILLVTKKSKKKEDEEEEETGVYSPKIRARVEQMPGEIVLNETREQGLKKQIREFTSSSPEVVAQLIRTWLKEGEDDDE